MAQPRRGAKRPTIADVARLAGVSEGAVSFAVNDRPGVSAETRERILRAAEELGWRPSAQARALTQARAFAVGLVMARSVDGLDADDFFTRFLVGLERALARRDFALLLRVIGQEEDIELEAYRRLAQVGRVDGVILTDVRRRDPRFAILEQAGLPAVLAGQPLEPCPFPAVETDHAAGVTALTEHLIGLGHRKIAFAGGNPELEHVQTREAAWRAAVEAAGVEPGPSDAVVAGDAGTADVTGRLLGAADPPTAVMYASDQLAAAGLAVARERGLRVPEDLSITGFDDAAVALHCSPPLTTVRLDYVGFGEAAADVLLAEIHDEPRPELPGFPAELVLRGSTGPPTGS
jgi:DNA-binding LacI/PurR family transcriptional regulator